MAKKEKKYLYEGMYIVSATLSDEALKKSLERITGVIESRGGEIHKIHDQGRQKLAYQINGAKQGNYYLIYFSAFSHSITEVWKEYQLNEDLIRFITLRTDKVLETIEFKPLKTVE